MSDRLDELFERQTKFMELLRDHDKMPEWPLDLTTKASQRLIKETVWNMVEELAEASYTLKNRMHRITDARVLDIQHYKEELGDALAYLVEICILSGFTPQEIFDEYCRKNKVVQERLESGY
jgi:NTP pyrophosphatase (non-canonical NTP hydrolase)